MKAEDFRVAADIFELAAGALREIVDAGKSPTLEEAHSAIFCAESLINDGSAMLPARPSWTGEERGAAGHDVPAGGPR